MDAYTPILGTYGCGSLHCFSSTSNTMPVQLQCHCLSNDLMRETSKTCWFIVTVSCHNLWQLCLVGLVVWAIKGTAFSKVSLTFSEFGKTVRKGPRAKATYQVAIKFWSELWLRLLAKCPALALQPCLHHALSSVKVQSLLELHLICTSLHEQFIHQLVIWPVKVMKLVQPTGQTVCLHLI